MDYYYTDYLGQKENQLLVSEFHNDIFTNMKYKREGSCYTIRKAKPTQLVHPEDSFFIPFEFPGKKFTVFFFNVIDFLLCCSPPEISVAKNLLVVIEFLSLADDEVFPKGTGIIS